MADLGHYISLTGFKATNSCNQLHSCFEFS